MEEQVVKDRGDRGMRKERSEREGGGGGERVQLLFCVWSAVFLVEVTAEPVTF